LLRSAPDRTDLRASGYKHRGNTSRADNGGYAREGRNQGIATECVDCSEA